MIKVQVSRKTSEKIMYFHIFVALQFERNLKACNLINHLSVPVKI